MFLGVAALLVPKSEGSTADGVQGLIRGGVDEFFSPLSTRSCEPEEGIRVGFCIFSAKTCQVGVTGVLWEGIDASPQYPRGQNGRDN